jgi:hypothetical protein
MLYEISAADQTRTDDPLVNSQLSSEAYHGYAMNLLYHAELQRRNIEQNQAQIKCLESAVVTCLYRYQKFFYLSSLEFRNTTDVTTYKYKYFKS